VALTLTVNLFASGQSGSKSGEKKFKVGFISPGSDTWYLRAEEGVAWACKVAGADLIAVNSNRNYEKEQANIDYLINEGVDLIINLMWNEAGVLSTAEKASKAGIGSVLMDDCGAVLSHNIPFNASVNFDWGGMGQIYADWMKANYPGSNYVYVNGLLDSIVCQMVTESLKKATTALGSNKEVDNRLGEYNPEVAANVAQDMVNSGLDFSIIGVINEDCAAAIITRLEDMGVKNKYHVFAENGSDTGIALLKAGKLDFTISSSPGLEGAVAVFAGIDAVRNKKTKLQVDCPIASANTQNVDDPYAIIPWKVNDDVWSNIIKKSFPQYAYFFNK